VRIGPNELVFMTPQAAKGKPHRHVLSVHIRTVVWIIVADIYLAQNKNLETFVQVGFDTLDTGDNGITGEPDPVRHRKIAKKLASAFSKKNLKTKEATILKHINIFINQMKETVAGKHGAELQCWTDRLGLDLSADMVYGGEMGQMRDRECEISFR
jgi:hypothetical protein